MCIIFFIVCDDEKGQSPWPDYKLILASNRDEDFHRPTKPVAIWDGADHVIAGRDLEEGKEGGAWLGVSAKGQTIKLGALLNLTGEKKTVAIPAGRGPIVANYLVGQENIFDYSDSLFRSKVQYNAFNFVSVELKEQKSCQIYHTSNAPNEIKEFPTNEVLGFSNSGWKIPLMKVDHGKKLFHGLIEKCPPKDNLVDGLMDLLKDETKFPQDPELMRRVRNMEKFSDVCTKLSSINVSVPEIMYGSRTRTVILIDRNNQLDFYEETWLEGNNWTRSHIVRQLLE